MTEREANAQNEFSYTGASWRGWDTEKGEKYKAEAKALIDGYSERVRKLNEEYAERLKKLDKELAEAVAVYSEVMAAKVE